MKHILPIVALIPVLLACHQQRPPTTAPTSTPEGIQYSGGDGSDCDHAVVITGAAHTGEGIDAEDSWIESHFPGARKTGQGLSMRKEKAFDLIEIDSKDGVKREVCFDITAFFGKW